MKTKVLNILIGARNVLLYVIISWVILEIILLVFPIKIILRIPNFLDIYNYTLVVLIFSLILGIIFLPEKRTKNALPEKIIKEQSSFKRKIRSRYGSESFLVRGLSFLLLGFLCGAFFILSYVLLHDNLLVFSKWFRPLSILFIPVYLILSGFIIKDRSKWYLFITDTVLYTLGGGVGVALCFSILIIIWLIEFLSTRGFLWFLYF